MFAHRRLVTKTLAVALTVVALTGPVSPARATFHFMQIEQVIGGVDGSAATQAVQLRMRSAGQNLMASARLYAWNALGQDPVLLIDFTQSVANGASGARVLAATADFSTKTNPPLTPDFVLTNPIPESYLAAGSLTFEDDFGSVYWRLSWGGNSYLGSGTGLTTNDLDGNFNPPFDGPLPSATGQALQIQIASTAFSTNNFSNYLVTDESAVFTNNAGASGTIQSLVSVEEGGPGGILSLTAPFPNPVRQGMQYGITLPREARARVAVHDVLGRRVALLVDETLAGGRHDLRWEATTDAASRLASGVYFLELRFGDERRVQPFVLLR